MAGAFNNLFILQKVDPAAEMGTGSGNRSGRVVVAGKEDEIPLRMEIAYRQRCRYLNIAGFRLDGKAEKTEQRIYQDRTYQSSRPLDESGQEVTPIFLVIFSFSVCSHYLIVVLLFQGGLNMGRNHIAHIAAMPGCILDNGRADIDPAEAGH